MRLLSVSFLRTFAALIIINSHCGSLYPIAAFAKGGALGNSLFFLMSGFLLYPIKMGFTEWIKKRYVRLYIPTLILGVLLIIIHYVTGEMNISLLSLFFTFIFPEHRWFVCALIIMYPLFYIINTNFAGFKNYIFCSVFLMALYIIIYYFFLDTSKYVVERALKFHGFRFNYIVGFFLLLTGAVLHSRINLFLYKLNISRIKNGLIYVFTFLSFFCYFIFVYLMNKYPVLCRYQFLETIFCITTTIGFFITAIVNESNLRNIKGKYFTKFLKIGDLTLETYLIHFLVIDFIRKNINVFPLNIVLVFCITIIIAVYFNKMVKLIDRYIMNDKCASNVK